MLNVFARLEWKGNPLIFRALETEWIRLARIAWRSATPALARHFITWESRAS